MAIFPGEPGLACQLPPLIILLHLFLNCKSFPDRPELSMSFLTQSHQVFFGRPLCLIPSTFHVIQCLTHSLSYFCSTRPNHLNLLYLIVQLIFSLTPHIHYTHFSTIQLQFMPYFHRPGVTAMHQTTPHTSRSDSDCYC